MLYLEYLTRSSRRACELLELNIKTTGDIHNTLQSKEGYILEVKKYPNREGRGKLSSKNK